MLRDSPVLGEPTVPDLSETVRSEPSRPRPRVGQPTESSGEPSSPRCIDPALRRGVVGSLRSGGTERQLGQDRVEFRVEFRVD